MKHLAIRQRTIVFYSTRVLGNRVVYSSLLKNNTVLFILSSKSIVFVYSIHTLEY